MKRLPIMLIAVCLLGGCASTPRAQTSGPHAECPVCKANADLACIDVAVNEKTPSCTCDGKTYYFCSEDCRKDFEKNPQKYAAPQVTAASPPSPRPRQLPWAL